MSKRPQLIAEINGNQRLYLYTDAHFPNWEVSAPGVSPGLINPCPKDSHGIAEFYATPELLLGRASLSGELISVYDQGDQLIDELNANDTEWDIQGHTVRLIDESYFAPNRARLALLAYVALVYGILEAALAGSES